MPVTSNLFEDYCEVIQNLLSLGSLLATQLTELLIVINVLQE